MELSLRYMRTYLIQNLSTHTWSVHCEPFNIWQSSLGKLRGLNYQLFILYTENIFPRTVIKDAFNQLDPKKQGVVPTAKIAEGMQKCGINLRRDQLQQIMNDLEEEGEKLRLFVLSTRCQKHCIRKMYKLTLIFSIQHYAILHRQGPTNILPGVQHRPNSYKTKDVMPLISWLNF